MSTVGQNFRPPAAGVPVETAHGMRHTVNVSIIVKPDSSSAAKWVQSLSGYFYDRPGEPLLHRRRRYHREDGAQIYWDDGRKNSRGWWIETVGRKVYAWHDGEGVDVPLSGWKCPGMFGFYTAVDLQANVTVEWHLVHAERSCAHAVCGCFSMMGAGCLDHLHPPPARLQDQAAHDALNPSSSKPLPPGASPKPNHPEPQVPADAAAGPGPARENPLPPKHTSNSSLLSDDSANRSPADAAAGPRNAQIDHGQIATKTRGIVQPTAAHERGRQGNANFKAEDEDPFWPPADEDFRGREGATPPMSRVRILDGPGDEETPQFPDSDLPRQGSTRRKSSFEHLVGHMVQQKSKASPGGFTALVAHMNCPVRKSVVKDKPKPTSSISGLVKHVTCPVRRSVVASKATSNKPGAAKAGGLFQSSSKAKVGPEVKAALEAIRQKGVLAAIAEAVAPEVPDGNCGVATTLDESGANKPSNEEKDFVQVAGLPWGVGMSCRKGVNPEGESPNSDAAMVFRVPGELSFYIVASGTGERGHEASEFAKALVPTIAARDPRIRNEGEHALDAVKAAFEGASAGVKDAFGDGSGAELTMVIFDHASHSLLSGNCGSCMPTMAQWQTLTYDVSGVKHSPRTMRAVDVTSLAVDVAGPTPPKGSLEQPGTGDHSIGLMDRAIIIASPGVWARVEPAQAGAIVRRCAPEDAQWAATMLTKEAWYRWMDEEPNGGYVPDITAIVAYTAREPRLM